MTGSGDVFAINLEEPFQFASRRHGVPERHWERFAPTVEQNAGRALRLLADAKSTATFFVGGWIAARHGALLAEIARHGHEIASCASPIAPRASDDRSILGHDAADVKELVEAATGVSVAGCRISCRSSEVPLWLEEELRSIGLRYQARNVSRLRFTSGRSDMPAEGPAHLPLVTIEIPTLAVGGVDWPVASSMLLRQLPERLVEPVLGFWERQPRPLVVSCNLWELDPEQPEIATRTALQGQMCYRNLDLTAPRLRRLCERFRFGSFRASLGLHERPVSRQQSRRAPIRISTAERLEGEPLTVVVPCYNEETTLPYLKNALTSLDAHLGSRHPLSFILVDDGSTDSTSQEMERLFGGDARFRLLRHAQNRGIAAASLTGITAAKDEIVAVIDSDCSYDPLQIGEMVDLLTPDVALVTASPYHPEGVVTSVPRWRLGLSRSLSILYRLVLHNKLATYTSCFRLYRRSTFDKLAVRNQGFIGVAETLVRLDLQGHRIVEHPAVLERRLLGHSKLRIIRTIIGHLFLLTEISLLRLARSAGQRPTFQATR